MTELNITTSHTTHQVDAIYLVQVIMVQREQMLQEFRICDCWVFPIAGVYTN